MEVRHRWRSGELARRPQRHRPEVEGDGVRTRPREYIRLGKKKKRKEKKRKENRKKEKKGNTDISSLCGSACIGDTGRERIK